MKHRYDVITCLPYQTDRLCRRLEKRAREGWQLEKAWALLKYRKDTPRPTRYAAAFFNEISAYDPEPTERQEEYNALCAAAGWEQVAQIDNLQIFRTDDPDAPPLETDDSLRLASVRRGMHKSLLSFSLLAFVCLLQLVSRVQELLRNPVWSLSDNLDLMMLVFWPILLLFLLVQLGTYGVWLYRACRAVDAGRPLPNNSPRWVDWMQRLIFTVEAVLLLLMTAALELPFAGWAIVQVVLIYGAGYGMYRICKACKASRGANLAMVLITVLVMSFAVNGMVLYWTMKRPAEVPANAEQVTVTHEDGGQWTTRLYRDTLTLTPADLGIEIPEESYSFYRREERSVLARLQIGEVDSPLPGEENNVRLQYKIFDTVLWADKCLEEWKQEAGTWDGTTVWRTDDPLWQADEVWEIRDDTDGGTWIVRRGNRLLWFECSWEPTEAQLTQAAALMDCETV